MHLVNGTILLASLFLAGCASPSQPDRSGLPPMWHRDTPAVRKLQEKETAKHFPQAATRRHLRDNVGACVEIIYENPDEFDSGRGRAVAITADGYYLTAEHVIDESPFFLVEGYPDPRPQSGSTQTTDPRPDSDPKHYAGRLVWSDPELDLALLKFERPSPRYFEKIRPCLKPGELVYSADDGGWAIYPLPVKPDEIIKLSDILGGMVGNGAFFSAGKVVASKTWATPTKVSVHSLTLIARGGMSGGPLVTMDQELCGIVARVTVRPGLFGWPPTLSPKTRTHAIMVDPGFIQEKIRTDRAANSTGPSAQSSALD